MQTAATDWITKFIRHLALERQLSPHTRSNYQRDLDALAKWCTERNLDDWNILTHADIRVMAATFHRRGLAPKSIARRLAAIRSFYRYLIREGVAGNNPADDVSAPKAAKRLPATMDVDQVGQLLNIAGNEPMTLRDRAILELFYSSGLRLAELCDIDLVDLDLEDGLVRVTGKGAKTRIVPVGQHAVTALREWLAARAMLAIRDEAAVFVGTRGKRIGTRTVQQRIAWWSRKQGIGRHVYPHMLRHSFASHMLESSGDLRAVQELLGHANISTTQIYTHLDFQHLAEVYDKAHPRARRKKQG